MEDSEKAVALKKAYADIILNTAKEAARRVMASEQRALRFQQELTYTKDEALRLLVRLKQMIDAKTIEAEKTSLNQRKKIEVLEAQLHEAEDIVTDLRAELNFVRDKLEKVKNSQVQHFSGKVTGENRPSLNNVAPVPITHSPLHSGFVTMTNSDVMDEPLSQRYLDNKCCNTAKQMDCSNISHLGSHYAHNSDLATITGNKKPDLYIAQRINASERKLLDRNLPPSGLEDEHSLSKNELFMEMNAEHEEKSTVPSPKIKNMEIMIFSGKEIKSSRKLHSLRRRKTRLESRATSRRCRPGKRMKSCQPSSFSRCRRYAINKSVKSGEGLHSLASDEVQNMDLSKSSRRLDEELLHKSSSYKDETVVIPKGRQNRNLKSKNSFVTSINQSTVLTCCENSSKSICANGKSDEDQLGIAQNDAKVKLLPSLDPGLTLNESNVDPKSGFKNVFMSVKTLKKCRLVQTAADRDLRLREVPVLVRQEDDNEKPALVSEGSHIEEISTLPSSEVSSELVNVPLKYSDLKGSKESEITERSSVEAANNRLLKFTFQRKRKKEYLSDPDGMNSPEKNSVKRRAGEKQNGAQEAEKLDLMSESRDGRRLAQVARQLISLSGKRWW